jgi:hypothetical protein
MTSSLFVSFKRRWPEKSLISSVMAFEFFVEVDFVQQTLNGSGSFAEFGAGVFADEGAIGEEVERLVRILHLGDEFIGAEIASALFRNRSNP